MTAIPHAAERFTAAEIVRDNTISISDELWAPFALAVGVVFFIAWVIGG